MDLASDIQDNTKRKLNEESENEEINNRDSVSHSKKLNTSLPPSNSDLTTNNKLKEEYLNKIRKVIESHFDEEINYKQYELEKINDRIFEAQSNLDKLRVCIICRYYSLSGRLNLNDYINHPAIASLKLEDLDLAIDQAKQLENYKLNSSLTNNSLSDNLKKEDVNYESAYAQLSKIKIFVGNVSKSLVNQSNTSQLKQKSSQINTINEDESISCSIKSSQYNQDLITHKWMVYIRSPNCSRLENYIKKVVFYLHFSYKPYDVVEVKSPPFQLIKKGWGEFPIHVQIHFKDPRNKRVDINHQIKLDWTQTGLQTFGGETSHDCNLIIKKNDLINSQTETSNQIITKESNYQNQEQQKNINYNNTTNLRENAPQMINMDEASNESKNQNKNVNSINNDDNQNSMVISNETARSETIQLRSLSIDDSYSNSSLQSQQSQFSSFSTTLTKQQFIDSLNMIESSLSPSNFITADIDSVLNADTDKKSNRKRLDTNSFDELMMNFSSSEPKKENIEEDNKKTNQIESINKHEEATKKDIYSKKQIPPSIDELLNIRPITLPQPTSLINAATVNVSSNNSKVPLSLIKSLKPISIVGNRIINTQNVVTPPKIINPLSTLAAQPKDVNSKPDQNNITASALINNTNIKANNIVIKNSNPKITSIQSPVQNQITNMSTNNNNNNILNNKNMVIYKVGSSDLNNQSKTIPSSLQKYIQQTQQNKESSASAENLNQTSMMINLSKSENQSNNNLKIINNSIAVAKPDKINSNIESNKFQLTKIKPKQQQQQQLIEDALIVEKYDDSILNAENNEEILNNLTDSSKEIESKKENEYHISSKSIENKLLYTIDHIINIIHENQDLSKNNFENYLKIALRYYPIISNNIKRKHTPFIARSIHEFYSWPYGKRKASEWMRAIYIKKKCQYLIELSTSLNSITVWSTKSIVLWLRSHGYTPLEYKHMFLHDPTCMLTEENLEFHYVDSLSSINEMKLFQEKYSNKINILEDDEEVIDVVSDEANDNLRKNKNDEKINLIEEELNKNESNYIEMCEGSKHIKEQLDMLKIKTNTVNLVPDFEEPNETNKYSCNLVEKMLFAIYKRFAEDIIRDTCSNIYFDSTRGIDAKSSEQSQVKKQGKYETKKQLELAQLAQQQQQQQVQENELQYQKFPQYLSVNDVFKTIKKHEKYDFLTNKFMAKLDQNNINRADDN